MAKKAARKGVKRTTREPFAQVIQLVRKEKTIIGFGTNPRTIVAVVPVDALRMIAGEKVSDASASRLRRMARPMLKKIPKRSKKNLVPVRIAKKK